MRVIALLLVAGGAGRALAQADCCTDPNYSPCIQSAYGVNGGGQSNLCGIYAALKVCHDKYCSNLPLPTDVVSVESSCGSGGAATAAASTTKSGSGPSSVSATATGASTGMAAATAAPSKAAANSNFSPAVPAAVAAALGYLSVLGLVQ